MQVERKQNFMNFSKAGMSAHARLRKRVQFCVPGILHGSGGQELNLGCARVSVWRICKAARMLQESILSEARIVSAFSVVLCSKVWVPSPRASTSRANMSRTCKRKSSVQTPFSANAARFPANSTLAFRHCPGVSPSSTACSPPY